MTDKELIIKLLENNKGSVHPGRGKQNAQLVIEACAQIEVDPEPYLEKYVLRNPKEWGVEL